MLSKVFSPALPTTLFFAPNGAEAAGAPTGSGAEVSPQDTVTQASATPADAFVAVGSSAVVIDLRASMEDGLAETAANFRAVFGSVSRDTRAYIKDLISKDGITDDLAVIDRSLAAYEIGERAGIQETVTGGGWYLIQMEEELTGGHNFGVYTNETVINHLAKMNRDHGAFKDFFEYIATTPFFRRMESFAEGLAETALQIKLEIVAEAGIKPYYHAHDDMRMRERFDRYLDGEFKKKDRIIDLLHKLKVFYETMQKFVESIVGKAPTI